METFWNTGRKKRKKEIRKRQNEINDSLIKDRIIRDIRTLFEQEDDDYYFKPKRVSDYCNNNYIEYESNGYRKTCH